MLTTTTTSNRESHNHFGSRDLEGDQGVVTVTSRAGRLLFALLLSPAVTSMEHLSPLANVPRKLLPAVIDELVAVELVMITPDPENAVDAGVVAPVKSITHQANENPSPNYLVPVEVEPEPEPEPEEVLEAACKAADQVEEPVSRARAQAIALVEAWKFFFPEVNKVQELQPRKAKEWVKVAGSASAVFGWLGGVEEKYLLGRQFPLGTMNIIITRKAEEAKTGVRQEDKRNTGDEGAGVPDEWRRYAKKIVEQSKDPEGRANNHGAQNGAADLQRIARAVQTS